MKILLVEDTEYVAESMIGALEMRGHTVDWRKNVSEARLALAYSTFDVSVLDYDLGLDEPPGPTLIPDLHERGIPCCVYTGLAPRGVDFGVPVIEKSDPSKLLAWIEKGGVIDGS